MFFRELKNGWADLCGSTIGLACGVAMYTPIQSLFFRALEIDFHWSKAAIAGSLLALPITALALPVVGRLLDRFGVRLIVGISAAIMALAFLGLSAIGNSLALFYLGFIAFNVLGSATGPIGYTRPIAHRFTAARGTAVAIALSGIAVAGVLLPPLLAPLLAHGGWRNGYRLLAAIALIGALAAIALIRDPGQRVGSTAGEGLTRAEAIRTRGFWLLGAAIFAVSAASVGFVSQLQSVALEFGVPLRQTMFILSAVALSTLPSRLLAGWALDVLPPERTATAFIIVSGIGQIVWLVAPGTFGYALIGAVLLGVSLGSEHAFLSYFCARIFGLRVYSSIFGALAVFLYLGMAAGGVFFASTHDHTGSYSLAISVSIAAMALSAGLFLSLPRGFADPAYPADNLRRQILRLDPQIQLSSAMIDTGLAFLASRGAALPSSRAGNPELVAEFLRAVNAVKPSEGI